MIAVIDYNAGNLRSVANALKRLGADYVITENEREIRSASHVVLPGVGHARVAMDSLNSSGLSDIIRGLSAPVLGICIGMQLMCLDSEEGDTPCMGIFNTRVKRFAPAPDIKIPHMGWDQIENLKTSLFNGLNNQAYIYYVHSYYPELCSQTIAATTYGSQFSAALNYNNFYGTQFHPEKSGSAGARILKNFLEL